jgi:hypothetical protein
MFFNMISLSNSLIYYFFIVLLCFYLYFLELYIYNFKCVMLATVEVPSEAHLPKRPYSQLRFVLSRVFNIFEFAYRFKKAFRFYF